MGVAAALPPLPALSVLLIASYHHCVGWPLLPPGIPKADHARWLYDEAPFCVLAHYADPDPRIVYANRVVQGPFQYSWEEFLALSSRLSAEVAAQAERQRLLDAATRDGVASGCGGLRRQIGPTVLDRGRGRLAAHRSARRNVRPGGDVSASAGCRDSFAAI